jgi:2',3'-cyclic-nucleotide 2'-phosphodiesterase
MGQSDCPFQRLNAELEEIRSHTSIIVVDFHAETTSEKQAFGWFLDGRVSAVVGTHTHVQTADETILPQGTAYISDLGMTGARDGILGMQRAPIVQKFLDQMPVRFEPAQTKNRMLNGLVVEVNPETGQATSVFRINVDMSAGIW